MVAQMGAMLCTKFSKASSITQLIYCSHLSGCGDASLQRDNVAAIVNRGRAVNAVHGITGALLFDGKMVAHVIEGPWTDVQQLYSNITRDPRHHSIVPLQCAVTNVRLFGSWSLAFVEVEHMPYADSINMHSTPMVLRKACISVLQSFRPLLTGK